MKHKGKCFTCSDAYNHLISIYNELDFYIARIEDYDKIVYYDKSGNNLLSECWNVGIINAIVPCLRVSYPILPITIGDADGKIIYCGGLEYLIHQIKEIINSVSSDGFVHKYDLPFIKESFRRLGDDFSEENFQVDVINGKIIMTSRSQFTKDVIQKVLSRKDPSIN